jgi:signal transduction histidine kinase
MRRLRWLTIVVPVAFVGAIELLSDTLLDPLLPFPLDTVVVALVVLVLAVLFSRLAFRRIDRLDAALRARNAELEARNASARALRQVSVAMTAIADLDDILQATVDNARRLLDGEVALICLTAADGSARLRASSGPVEALDPDGDRTDDGNGAPDDVRRFLREPPAGPLLVAPLRRGDQALGTLAVVRGPGRPAADDDDVETLDSLARQAAIAIETDRLQVELRDLAVRGERERIARELHDGLAQVLGYVNAKSQAVDELLAAGRHEEARSRLGELAAAARSQYVDVREAILGLRGPVAARGGLVASLRAYGGRFAEASKLVVRVEATDRSTRVRLDPAVEDEAFRIVREALTNVRKHAAARRVTIRLDEIDDSLVVEVEDDGRGFEPAATEAADDGRPRLGLSTMSERAASVGGRIEWRPGSGGGTVVRLAIPLVPSPDPAIARRSATAGTGPGAGR